MKLLEVLKRCRIKKIKGNCDIDIKGIAFNANDVKNGYMFICLNGSKTDGRNYIREAINNGAICVVGEKEEELSIATVVTLDAREVLSIAAQNFYKNPIKYMKFISVIGTNGKSTTGYLIYKILMHNNIKAGLIGTMYYMCGNEKYNSNMTTPDPIELNRMLSIMKENDVKIVVVELSAHAIYLKKTVGIVSEISIFTNFSQDHLDYFKTIDDYKAAKISYFNSQNVKLGIINSDDNVGREILKNATIPMLSYGIDSPSDVFAMEIKYLPKTSFLANIMNEICEIKSMLFGKFNISNILAAIACVRCLGVSINGIVESLEVIEPPEGRFNVFKKNGVGYVIDFAHTPDGLYNLLKESKRLCKNRIITVFGCGGDRDVSKRPIMGKIVSAMSDISIITNDNPRTESPQHIVEDILEGIPKSLRKNVYIELDRGKAIAKAVKMCEDGDLVLIAGKGSEGYIDEGGYKREYSDQKELLDNLNGGTIGIY